LALLVSTVLVRQRVPAQHVVVASVEKKLGDISVREGGAEASPLTTGTRLLAGSVLSTSRDSRLALTWINGESVRADQDSRLSLVSATEIDLLEGSLYIDSRGMGAGDVSLVVQTPTGPVQHIGTQYLTSVHGEEVTVSVREGEVAVGSGDEKVVAVQGQKLRVTKTGQRSTTVVPTYGGDWQWTELVAPRFDTDGRSVRELLEWVGRETGRTIEYGSPGAESMAAETRMHGNVDLEPLRAMEVMLQTSDLIARVEDGVILVSF
jgi:ferric-dicitrate binding protein FerR (iron transport regulator)